MIVTMSTVRGGLRPTVLRENGVLIVAAFGGGLLLVQVLRTPVARVLERLRSYVAGYRALRALAYAALVLTIVVFESDVTAFVYFQF
jgi:hypothetical protein